MAIIHKKLIALILLIAISGSFMSTTVNAYDVTQDDINKAKSAWNFIGTIRSVVGFIKTLKNLKTGNNLPENVPHIFVFGGHITHSEGGCALNFKVIIYGVGITCFGICAIPLGGTTLEVGPPVDSPEGQMFTFPYISDIYANHSEGREGPWALGIGFTPFPIDEINDALGKIPDIYVGTYPYVGNVYIGNWYLKCSDNDKNVILKMGTSK